MTITSGKQATNAWSSTVMLFLANLVNYYDRAMAVGVGEASYGPAGASMIGDLFPTNKRSRAMALYWLGLPMGLIFVFFTTGALIQYFQTWRASFVVAMIPGLLLAVAMLFVREPARGAGDAPGASTRPIDRPFRRILRVRTVWWIVAAGVASNFAAYAANSFLVPLLQRYNGLSLQQAAMAAKGATEVSNHARALGLHDAMYVIPIALLLTAVALVFAARTFQADADAMQRGLVGEALAVQRRRRRLYRPELVRGLRYQAFFAFR